MAVALLFCFIWWLILRSARRYSSAKFEVLQDIEAHLPIRPFDYEWIEVLKRGKRYMRIQMIYRYIPWIFAGLYVVMGLMLYKAVNPQ